MKGNAKKICKKLNMISWTEPMSCKYWNNVYVYDLKCRYDS